MAHPISAKHAFEVVARAHAKLIQLGYKPKANLLGIGRELGLKENVIQSIRQKAVWELRKRGLPKSLEEKGWVWPTPEEEHAHREESACAA